MVETGCDAKGMRHRLWAAFMAHLAFLKAVFNVLVQREGLKPGDAGRIHLSIAPF